MDNPAIQKLNDMIAALELQRNELANQNVYLRADGAAMKRENDALKMEVAAKASVIAQMSEAADVSADSADDDTAEAASAPVANGADNSHARSAQA